MSWQPCNLLVSTQYQISFACIQIVILLKYNTNTLFFYCHANETECNTCATLQTSLQLGGDVSKRTKRLFQPLAGLGLHTFALITSISPTTPLLSPATSSPISKSLSVPALLKSSLLLTLPTSSFNSQSLTFHNPSFYSSPACSVLLKRPHLTVLSLSSSLASSTASLILSSVSYRHLSSSGYKLTEQVQSFQSSTIQNGRQLESTRCERAPHWCSSRCPSRIQGLFRCFFFWLKLEFIFAN